MDEKIVTAGDYFLSPAPVTQSSLCLELEQKLAFLVEFGSDPVTETVDTLKERNISLLVVSVHPGEPWTTHLHHDAYRMVAESPCPVLVVQRRF